MGKDFLKLKTDRKKLYAAVLGVGILLTAVSGVKAYGNTRLLNDCELLRNRVGEGSSEQDVIAYADGYGKIPVTVKVTEEILSKEEADRKLNEAAVLLENILKDENDSLSNVTGDLNFAEEIPGSPVQVEWTETQWDYFDSGGALRKEIDLKEPVELELSAVLSCQGYLKDYRVIVRLMPKGRTEEEKFADYVLQETQKQQDPSVLILPREYEGRTILWRKPLDLTFLYLLVLTAASVVFLKVGGKRDEKEEKKRRKEEMEKDYAEIVGKFTMLLSAGLSVRNSWERIVRLYEKNQGKKRIVYEEMRRSFQEMEKGISELEVYESFGLRTGLVHYKKLMSLFVSDQRRGSIRLLEAMEQELYEAWEEQKRKIRQQGEKIGTKLLAPMMGMLAVVFVMIMVPAFLSFRL